MLGELLHSTTSLTKSHLKTGITVETCDTELADPPIHDPLHADDGVGNELRLLTDTRVVLLRYPTVGSIEVNSNKDSGSSVFG